MKNASSNSENVLSEYEHLSLVYDRKWSHYIKSTLEKVMEFCPLSGEEDVLDVGCGTGELEKRLVTKYNNLQIVGCDISSGMLKIAKKKMEGYDNVSFIECPADKITLKDESKDIIICCNSFHFFKQPEKVLQEWHRILRQSGKVFIIDWCQDFWICKVLEFLNRNLNGTYHHIYTVNELSSMLVALNFRIVGNWGFKVGWFWGMMALSGQKILKEGWI